MNKVILLCLVAAIALTSSGCATMNAGATGSGSTVVHGYIESNWTKRF